MQVAQRTAGRWFWLVLIAFLATRLVDAHLHLCFDGQCPPSAVHIGDGSAHGGDHHEGETHADRDVAMFDELLAKKVADPADAFLIAFLAVLIILPAARIHVRAASVPLVLRPLFLLRPPLRGPPL